MIPEHRPPDPDHARDARTSVSCRTGPDTPPLQPFDTPETSIAGRIEREPFLEYPTLPGMGTPADDCGGAHVPTFCGSCGHPEVRPLGCDRWRCPDCYPRLRTRELRRKLTRTLGRDLQAFLEDNPGAPARAWANQVLHQERLWLEWRHVSISRKEDQDEILDEDAFRATRSRCNELAKEGGLEGVLAYPHPYRIVDELEEPLAEHGPSQGEAGLWVAAREDVLDLGTWEAYAKPGHHVHAIGHTGDDRWVETGDDVGQDDETFHVIEDGDGEWVDLDPERLKRLIAYLLSHTAVPDESLDRATYSGDLRKNLGAVDKWLDPRAVEVLEEVVDHLLDEDPDEACCSLCGSDDLRSIHEGLDVIQERERAGDPLEHERALRRAFWWMRRPEDVMDPPPEDPDQQTLHEWLYADEPLVLKSEIPQQQLPRPEHANQTAIA